MRGRKTENDCAQATVQHLKEPHIEAGEGNAIPEPKMGWTLVGPLGKQSLTYEINLGLIGDSESLEKTKELISRPRTSYECLRMDLLVRNSRILLANKFEKDIRVSMVSKTPMGRKVDATAGFILLIIGANTLFQLAMSYPRLIWPFQVLSVSVGLGATIVGSAILSLISWEQYIMGKTGKFEG